MVQSTLRAIDANLPIKLVHASRGKLTRAEPISALYEQNRVYHVGTFPQLEDQLTSFTSDFDRSSAGFSPDRLDALVWGLFELVGPRQQEIPITPPFNVTGGNYYRGYWGTNESMPPGGWPAGKQPL